MLKEFTKERLVKAFIIGAIIGIAGIGINLFPAGTALEENFGLDLLFTMRGTRVPPEDVVIVSIDKESADRLDLPEDPRKWPRSLHAKLIDVITAAGAAVIVFDVNFSEPRSSQEDNELAEAIRRSRNTVLCEFMQIENVPIDNKTGSTYGEMNIAKVVPPIPSLARAAFARAPFPLPKISNKVSQYWTFMTSAGDKPTLPVVSFQIFVMQYHLDFIRLMDRVNAYHAEKLRQSHEDFVKTRGVEKVIRDIRHIFQGDPHIGAEMVKELESSRIPFDNKTKHAVLHSLITLYKGNSHSQYLNFYGPARTITTLPYYMVLQHGLSPGNTLPVNLKGKAVFVGLSQLSPIDQKESFYTVYSEKHGLDISGIEIAATAFANLLENRPVQPIDFRIYLGVIFVWGIVIGFICKRFSTTAAFFSMTGLVTAYLIFAIFQFKSRGIWCPVITPCVLQTTLALFSGVLWNYIEVKQERQNIKKAFGYYLPNDVVERLLTDIDGIHDSHQVVYGICMSTDAEQYSFLSEVMEPKELGNFMNRYYELIFQPIRQHGGIVSDVVGDSVLAIWVSAKPEIVLRKEACVAALDIQRTIYDFNRTSQTHMLPTRIGLHSGKILLGNIGAFDHYEYRPVGDIVNTASRLEGLNKYLGTQVLVTRDVVGQLDGFYTRGLGEFKLAGKTKPVEVYELICREEEVTEKQRRAGEMFQKAIRAFRNQSWDRAIDLFSEHMDYLGDDGPSQFFVQLCRDNREMAKKELWDGVVEIGRK